MARPSILTPLLDERGAISHVWIDYLTRELQNIALLSDSATLPEAVAKLNELIVALQTASLMKKE